jgi:hypothetical protein
MHISSLLFIAIVTDAFCVGWLGGTLYQAQKMTKKKS